MILRFPNLHTLQLAMTSRVVPEEAYLAPASVGVDAEKQIWLEPSQPLPGASQAELQKLGVEVHRTSKVALDHQALCWPQLIPARAAHAGWSAADRVPVLFEVSQGEELPELVGEMLRLGNDRQGFRWVRRGNDVFALLRVVGPPYYSLLRAVDQENGSAALCAYVEQNPRVWVKLGYTHPLIDRIQPPPGQILLIRPPRQWSFVGEGKFRDIYETLDITLPAPPVTAEETALEQRLEVPLRLVRGGAGEASELWILREDGVRQLDDFVRNHDDRLIHRLAFAVAEIDGEQMVAVRLRPSALPPPELILSGVGFRPYLKLPNLFVPVHYRLHPPLRRDAVAKFLASDRRQLTWLYPAEDGHFIPESLPEEAFRPLEDWVDYVLEHDHRQLTAWMQSTRFDFEPFVCREDSAQTKRQRSARKPPQTESPPPKPAKAQQPQPKSSEPQQLRDEETPEVEEPLPEVEPVKPEELQLHLQELEVQFSELDAPLEDPRRQDLWRQMATAHSQLGHVSDSTICWVNAIWEWDKPPQSWLAGWYYSETGRSDTFSSDDLDGLLSKPHPGPSDLTGLAAYLRWASALPHPPEELLERLGLLQQFLERHEGFLPVRAAWMAWTAISRLSQGDVLALARARDRLLERLYVQGLSPEVDLPSFLRVSGIGASERFRVVRDEMLGIRDLVQKWVAKSGRTRVQTDEARVKTSQYIDLLFACGLARLGEASESHELLVSARDHLNLDAPVERWLFRAFDYRIGQAREGKPNHEDFPHEWTAELEQLPGDQSYAIQYLRKHSDILEPAEKSDVYLHWFGRRGQNRAVASLYQIRDRSEREARLVEFLREAERGDYAARGNAIKVALDLAPRVNESFAQSVLQRVAPLLEELNSTISGGTKGEHWEELIKSKIQVLEKALFVSAHFGRSVFVHQFLASLHHLLDTITGAEAFLAMQSLLSQSIRGLRKLGMRDEISELLDHMYDSVRQVEHVQHRFPSMPQQVLLQVATGWLYFGQNDRALPVLEEAGKRLFSDTALSDVVATENLDRCMLAGAYLAALGQAPPELAVPRMKELFTKLQPIEDPSLTYKQHFSRWQLKIAEAVVLAMVSDDFTLDKESRRWLDEDEFLVRRRIHADLQVAVE